MKKTININLAGYPFTIDEDAYNLLKDYLDTIRYAFETTDDTAELAADIEARIAEILLEKEASGIRIVTFQDISGIIERIGRPADFIDIQETIQEDQNDIREEEIKIEEPITPPPYNPNTRNSQSNFLKKKLFRDPENSMLGGVCSGLAMYLGIDVTIVRLLTVLLFFLSATTVAIVYIILWIVVPEARTPLQRMQMMGKNPTIENIGKTVTETFQDDKDYGNNQGSGGFLSNVFSIFVKVLIFIGIFIALPLLLALAIGLLGCSIAIFAITIGIVSGGMFDSTLEGLFVLYILLAVAGGCITLGVPLWLLMKNFRGKKSDAQNPSSQRAMLIVWLCGIALVSVFSVLAVRKERVLERQNRLFHIEKTMKHEAEDPLELEIDLDDASQNGSVNIVDEDSIQLMSDSIKVSEQLTDSIK